MKWDKCSPIKPSEGKAFTNAPNLPQKNKKHSALKPYLSQSITQGYFITTHCWLSACLSKFCYRKSLCAALKWTNKSDTTAQVAELTNQAKRTRCNVTPCPGTQIFYMSKACIQGAPRMDVTVGYGGSGEKKTPQKQGQQWCYGQEGKTMFS